MGAIWEYQGVSTLGSEPSIANNWTTLNDLNWYSTVTYQTGDVILYNNNIYIASMTTTNENPETTGANGPWVIQGSEDYVWQVGQTVLLNEVVYHNGALWISKSTTTTSEPGTTNTWSLLGDLSFSINYTYATGDYVIYNNAYYVVTDGSLATGSLPGTSGWSQITVVPFTGSVGNNTEYTSYNGLLYKAVQGKVNGKDRNIVPGSAASKGIWQALNTQEWQQYNTYNNGDLVMYQGEVYELINSLNSSDTPGQTSNSWVGLKTVNYDSSVTYALNDYVVDNSEVFIVINVSNANANAPATSLNAWNQLSGYDWYFYNTYQVGEVVYYNDAVYQAIAITSNNQPDISTSFWALYEN